LELFRRNFQPSVTLEKPYAMVALNVIAAATDEEAKQMATSQVYDHSARLRSYEIVADIWKS
jgi:alkanesulfonate monooxygenase SsuD/methylene tetrahydromethanopterin reductase-like flavin-dependent oxidoreductase (luciferase family)